MHVLTIGLEQAESGSPVVVFEARCRVLSGSIRPWPTVSPPPLPGAAFSDRGHSFYTSALPPE